MTTAKPAGPLASKGCGTLFFGAFLAAGLFFEWMVVKTVVRSNAAHSWPEATCTIESSESRIDHSSSSPYGIDVRYRYDFGGRAFEGSRIALSTSTYSDYEKVQSRLDRYAPGSPVECWVNPRIPAEAILEQSSRAQAFLVLFPLIFVLVGGGGIYAMWRTPGPGEQRGAARIQATVGARSGRGGTAVAVVFFGIFLAAGLGVSYLFVGEARRAFEARTWPATACTVESSDVREHESTDDGHTSYTYSVDILYRYQANGRTYRSNRYQFVSGSSSGRDAKQAIVDEYPPGREFECFVCPSQPSLAVIHRELGARVLLFLLPLVFVLVGAGGIAGTLRGRGRSTRAAKQDAAVQFAASAERHGLDLARVRECAFLPAIPGDGAPLTLPPDGTPFGQLIGMTLFALIWNGIISVFLWQVVKGFQSGNPEWFLTLFMIPFVLIGLGAIFGIVYSALALANPRPIVKMKSAAVPVGGRFEISWELTGRSHVLDRLRIWLEGVETVTYRRGTTTHTETHSFRKIEVISTDDRRDFEQGRESVQVPDGVMHSFEAPSNKVQWSISVEGNIARWPNMTAKYKVVVLPHEASREDSRA